MQILPPRRHAHTVSMHKMACTWKTQGSGKLLNGRRLFRRQTQGRRRRPQPRGPETFPETRHSRRGLPQLRSSPRSGPARRPHPPTPELRAALPGRGRLPSPQPPSGGSGEAPRRRAGASIPQAGAAIPQAGAEPPPLPRAAHLLLPPAQPFAPLAAPLQFPDDVLALAQHLALLGAPLRRRLPPDAGHLPGTRGWSRRPAAAGRAGPGRTVPVSAGPAAPPAAGSRRAPPPSAPSGSGCRRPPSPRKRPASAAGRPAAAPLPPAGASGRAPLPPPPPRVPQRPPAPRRTAPQGSARRRLFESGLLSRTKQRRPRPRTDTMYSNK